MKKLFKKLRSKRSKIEERAYVVNEEKNKYKFRTYTSKVPGSSPTSSHLKLINKQVEEDIQPNFNLSGGESKTITRIRADINKLSTRLTFRERLRKLFRRRFSPKEKS
jgi:hypothetical protein